MDKAIEVEVAELENGNLPSPFRRLASQSFLKAGRQQIKEDIRHVRVRGPRSGSSVRSLMWGEALGGECKERDDEKVVGEAPVKKDNVGGTYFRPKASRYEVVLF